MSQWNDAIEAAANKVQGLRDHWTSPFGTTTWPAAFQEAVDAIRALKRPEAKEGDTSLYTCKHGYDRSDECPSCSTEFPS